MSVTATRPASAIGRGGSPEGPATPVLVRETAVRTRRRRGLWVAGAALVAVGGLTAAVLVGRAGDRVEVLAVARAVPVGQTIGESDVTVARVAADPALLPISASQRSDVVGRTAAVELRPGTLLTAGDVTDEAVPAAGEQLVGVAVRPGQLPARGVRAGDPVIMVPVPGGQTSGGSGTTTADVAPVGDPVRAQVVQVGPPDADGAVTVDVVVGEAVGPRVAALASTGRIALVLQPAGAR